MFEKALQLYGWSVFAFGKIKYSRNEMLSVMLTKYKVDDD